MLKAAKERSHGKRLVAGVVNVPLKRNQGELGSYFSKVVDSGQKEAKRKEKVFKKEKNSVAVGVGGDRVEGSKEQKRKVGEEARWLNRADLTNESREDIYIYIYKLMDK